MIDQLFHPCACFICIGILESPYFQLQFFLKLEDSYTLILQIPPRQLKFISCMCTFWGPRTLKGTWEDQCWIRTFQVLGTKRNIAHSCRVRTFSGPSLRKFLGPYKVGPRTDRVTYLFISIYIYKLLSFRRLSCSTRYKYCQLPWIRAKKKPTEIGWRYSKQKYLVLSY